MQSQLTSKAAALLAAIPLLVLAHAAGPDAGTSGVPGELGTCANAGCHAGTLNNAANRGSVSIAFPGGMTYAPGVKQRLAVTIADPAATQRAWGFELTARLDGNARNMAGSLASADANTQLLCADAGFIAQPSVPYSASGGQTCPVTFRPPLTLQYVAHNLAGYQASLGHAGSFTYQVDWTPPAAGSGDIVFYVAGNAANGDESNGGDHIYAATYRLTAPATGAAPAISPGGVLNATAFGGGATVAPGSWMEIYGANLAPTTRQWAAVDFNGLSAPTSLGGVKVTIGGQAAFVDYVSPAQVNAQVPSGVAAGPTAVTVTNGNGASTPASVTVGEFSPGLLAPPAFNIGGRQYVVAQFADGTFVLPTSNIGGATTRPAKVGETIVIYGVGFGPVVTAANQNIPAGQTVTAANRLVNPARLLFGTVAATPVYAGLAPGYVGLYQFNVVVPAVAAGNAVPLSFTLNGVAGTQTLYTAVQ
jgi:uncharacterized protein (TIGR03437 family)